MAPFCVLLFLLSIYLKEAKFDVITCLKNDQLTKGNVSFTNSLSEGIKQTFKNESKNHIEEEAQLTNIICEINKNYFILETIWTENPPIHSNGHFSVHEYNSLQKRIALINHNDPPLSQVMDTLIVTLISVKKAMESGKINGAIVKTLKHRLKFALNFVAKRNHIQIDSEFSNLSKDTSREYFLKEMTEFFEWSKIVLSDKKCGQKSKNEQDNANNFKDKSRTKRFLQFIAKAIEICDNGTAKRRKNANRRQKRKIIIKFSSLGFILTLVILLIFVLLTLGSLMFICNDTINLFNRTREALNNNFRVPQNDNTSLLAAFDQFPSIAVDNESDCAICLDQIRAGIHVKQLPSCEHIFHDDCIKLWIQGGHSACPMCRQQILAEAQNEHQMHDIASGAEMGNSSNDPSVIVQMDEEHQSQTSADEDEADQNAQIANV